MRMQRVRASERGLLPRARSSRNSERTGKPPGTRADSPRTCGPRKRILASRERSSFIYELFIAAPNNGDYFIFLPRRALRGTLARFSTSVSSVSLAARPIDE